VVAVLVTVATILVIIAGDTEGVGGGRALVLMGQRRVNGWREVHGGNGTCDGKHGGPLLPSCIIGIR
jgi:hypothetical protein